MYIINALCGLMSAARKGDKMLEPYDGKLSRTVLRRERGSNPSDLVDNIYTLDSKGDACLLRLIQYNDRKILKKAHSIGTF